MATVKAYRYQRNVIDDGLHNYGRTLWEIAVERPDASPEAKQPRWVISNESETFFADKAFAGLAFYHVNFYEGMTEEQICNATDAELEAIRKAAKDKIAKRDDQAREESRAQAQQIDLPKVTYDRMLKAAHYKAALEQAKNELQVDLKDLLGKSKGYVG